MPEVSFPVVSFADLAKFDATLAAAARVYDDQGAPPFSNGTTGALDPWELQALVAQTPEMRDRFQSALVEIGQHNEAYDAYRKKADRRHGAMFWIAAAVGFPASVAIAAATGLPAGYGSAFVGLVPGSMIAYAVGRAVGMVWPEPEAPGHGAQRVAINMMEYNQ